MLSNCMTYGLKRRPHTLCQHDSVSPHSNRQEAREFLTSDATKKIV